VCLLVTTVNCAKTAEPIVMPLEMWTRMGQRNHRWGPDPLGEGAVLGVRLAHCTYSQRYSLRGSLALASIALATCSNLCLLITRDLKLAASSLSVPVHRVATTVQTP